MTINSNDNFNKLLYEMKFKSRMNIFYHEGRESFFNGFISFTTFVSLIFSSVSFAAIGNIITNITSTNNYIISFCALLVAVLNGGVLAYGMHSKRILHSDLKKKWIDLLKDIQMLKDYGEGNILEIEKKMASINSSEPAPNMKKLEEAQTQTERAFGIIIKGSKLRAC